MSNQIITRRDLCYVVGILAALCIWFAAGRLSDNITVINYLSFAGTVVSILLAVVAIIYSFFQSYTVQSSTDRLNTSLSKLDDSIHGLTEFKSKLDDVQNKIIGFEKQLSESIETTEIQMKDMINQIQSMIDDNRNKQNEDIENIVKKNVSGRSFNDGSDSSVDDDDLWS